MMPIRLTMSGWGSYPDKSTVDFTKFYEGSLFLITGPTGAGKTTIFDAISFALYGDVSGKTREKTSVRSDFAAPDVDTYVELIFTHKGEEIKILRSPKYSRLKKRGEGFTTSNESAELYFGEEVPLVVVSDVNRKIDEIMGINYEQFKQIAMIAQGEFLELLIASSKDRVEILRNLFKTNQYERLQRLLSEKAKKLYIQIEERKHKIDEAIHSIEAGENKELESCLMASNYNYEKIVESSKEYLQEDKKDLRKLEKELVTLGDQIKELIISITEGEQLNGNIEKRQQIARALEKMQEEQEQIHKEDGILKKANLAEKVKVEERIYLEILERQFKLLQKLQTYEKEIKEIEPEYARCVAEFEETTTKEAEIVQFQGEYTVLEGYLPLLEQLLDVKNNLSKVNHKILEVEQNEESIIKEELEKQEVILNDQKELDSYVELEKRIGENNLLVQAGETQKKRYQEAFILSERLLEDRTRLIRLQGIYEATNKELKGHRCIYQEKEEIYKNAVVGIVAKLVKEDAPCPVCGSLDHPHIAEVSSEVPEEHELEELKNLVESKQVEYDKIYQDTAKKNAEVDSKEEQLLTLFVELHIPCDKSNDKRAIDLLKESYEVHTKQQGVLIANQQKYALKVERRDTLKSEIEKTQIALIKLKEQRDQNILILNKLKSERDVLLGNQDQLLQRIPDHLITNNPNIEENIADQIRVKMDQIFKQIETLKRSIQTSKEAYDLVKSNLLSKQTLLKNSISESEEIKITVELKRDLYYKTLGENEFQREEDYKISLRSSTEIEALAEKIKDYYEKLQVLNTTHTSLGEQIGEKTMVNLENLKEQLEQLETKRKEYLTTKENVTARLIGNQKAIDSICEKLKTKQHFEEEYGVVKDLDNASKGSNKERLVFEQYVLSSYFEDIIAAANQRLSTMTNSRYELLKVDRVTDARTTDSLNLEVLDNYTGKKRSVKTLSGGESFKAALALALGLSDIVQNNAGGIQIEALFIDEGFGSLDSESLDQALDTLTSLSEHNRLIGIISHVNELKERIDNQIIIEKGNNGSRIKA